jgi:Carbonic anhydrase
VRPLTFFSPNLSARASGRTRRSRVDLGRAAALLITSGVALAQIKEIPGERVTQTGTVESIDHQARVLSLKEKTGKLVTIDVPETVERFDEVKVGDKVTVTYYDNVTVRLKKPGEAPVNALEGALSSKNPAYVDAVARTNVVVALESLRRRSPILADLEKKGTIRVAGAMYDLATGKVDFLGLKEARCRDSLGSRSCCR